MKGESKMGDLFDSKIVADIHANLSKEDEREILGYMAYLHGMTTSESPPPKTELIPVGIYDGVDIEGCHVLDDSYTVYMEVEIWKN
jgi:hypothetical protein